jgi:hypothetical protein
MNAQLRIYLDQNKWIDLARAYHDRPDGTRFKPVLERIKLAVDEGKAIFPLSGTHVIETRKMANLPRRHRLSQAMSNVSRGWTIAPNYVITRFELRASVGKTFGDQLPAEPVVFGKGIPFACGIRQKLQNLEGVDVAMPMHISKMIDDYMSDARVIEDFMCGGDDQINLSAVKKYEQGQHEIAKNQEQFRNDMKPLGHAVHKRAYCANLTLAIRPKLIPILADFGKSMQDFLRLGTDKLMTFFSEVPTLDVETELAVARNEDWNKGIHTNDSSDISFLSVAIPYCDIVVTEKYWRHKVRTAKLDRKYNTIVLDDLAQLESQLG